MTTSIAANEHFGPRIWHGAELSTARATMTLPDEVLQELDHCVKYLRRNPLPVLALRTGDFELSATHEFAAVLHTELDKGNGFALLDRFPLAHSAKTHWSREDCLASYWLLASCIARPVAQSHDGKLLYDVTDRGRPAGNGVRPDVTNIGQNFHTDNSYNHVPPHYVLLLCLQPSRSGGESGVVNFGWALRKMRERHPDLAPRLFESFYFDRQREHAEGDVMVSHHPMIEQRDDHLIARLSHRQVLNGHRLAEQPLDDQGRLALQAFESILNETGVAATFMFETGQIQIINNRALGHCRSAFEDYDEPHRKRHLVRLWLRDSGLPGYGL